MRVKGLTLQCLFKILFHRKNQLLYVYNPGINANVDLLTERASKRAKHFHDTNFMQYT